MNKTHPPSRSCEETNIVIPPPTHWGSHRLLRASKKEHASVFGIFLSREQFTYMVPSNFDVEMKTDSLPSETTLLKDKDKDKEKDKDMEAKTNIARDQEDKKTANGGSVIHDAPKSTDETNGHTTDHDVDMTPSSGRPKKDDESRISEEMYKRLKRKLKEAMEVKTQQQQRETLCSFRRCTRTR